MCEYVTIIIHTEVDWNSKTLNHWVGGNWRKNRQIIFGYCTGVTRQQILMIILVIYSLCYTK